MYILSELTGKRYDSVEECLAAEEQIKKAEAEKEYLKNEAFEAMRAYLEEGGELNDLVKLFGNYKVVNGNFGYPHWDFWQ